MSASNSVFDIDCIYYCICLTCFAWFSSFFFSPGTVQEPRRRVSSLLRPVKRRAAGLSPFIITGEMNVITHSPFSYSRQSKLQTRFSQAASSEHFDTKIVLFRQTNEEIINFVKRPVSVIHSREIFSEHIKLAAAKESTIFKFLSI